MNLSFVSLRRAAGICLAVLLFFVCTAGAQRGTSGSIEGTIADVQGGAISGAKLRAVNSDTGLKLESVSDENGLFHFPVVPPGTYVVTAENAGFTNYAVRVTVAVGATIDLPIQLKVGTQVSSVTVTSETPILEVTRTSVESSVNERAVSDLPTLGRNFINFTLLTPGVTTDVRGGDISFAGQRGTLNSLIVDGSDNNNTFFGQTLGRTGSGRAPYQFSQDAVQEFQVNSNAYAAEYGSAGGAVINVVTKSGTNQFHGTGFEFFRDRSLNATDPIAKAQGKAKQPYHFNQFGGNFGGPVLKDRLFFFFDYDGQRNITQNLILPVSGCAAPSTDANITAACTYLLARSASWTSGFNQDVYLGKADWHINSNELLSVRINSQRFTGANLENGGPSNSLEHTGAAIVVSDTISGQLTSTLSPRFVNEFRAAYVRDNEPGQANSTNPEASVFNGPLQLTVGRNFFSPRFTNIKRGQFADVLTWIKGRHTVKFGGDVLTDSIANFFPGNFSGAYTFNSLRSFGCSLLGAPCYGNRDQFVQAFGGVGTTGPTTHPNLNEYSAFIQDEWRITTSFTLNPGLRYDYESIAQPSVLNPIAAQAGILTNRINRDKKNFGPRLGFAWTPNRFNQRVVVRGGYGIYFGRTPSILVGTAHSNNGLQVKTLTYSGTSIPVTYPNTVCGSPVANPTCPPPAPGPGVPTPPPPTIFVFNPNFVEPYTQQASLGIEYQLAKDTALTVSYLGVRGVHLQRTRDINLAGEVPATIGIAGTGTVLNYLRYPSPTGTPATCPAGLFVVTLSSPCRPNGNFQRIEEVESNANSIYSGLIVQLNKRFGHNYQILGSYTYGKVIDDAPDSTSVVPFSGGDDAKMVSDPGNVRADRSAGINDQRHRFVLSGVWNLNYAQRFSGAAKQILGGWEISGILTAQSGQPYSAMVNSDLNNDSNRSTDRTPGVGRNTFYLPRTVSLDPRVTKNVQLTERLRLQLIGEAFNIFNHTNINGVSRTQYVVIQNSPNPVTGKPPCALTVTQCLANPSNFPFQFPTSDITPRIVQLAAKFVF